MYLSPLLVLMVLWRCHAQPRLYFDEESRKLVSGTRDCEYRYKKATNRFEVNTKIRLKATPSDNGTFLIHVSWDKSPGDCRYRLYMEFTFYYGGDRISLNSTRKCLVINSDTFGYGTGDKGQDIVSLDFLRLDTQYKATFTMSLETWTRHKGLRCKKNSALQSSYLEVDPSPTTYSTSTVKATPQSTVAQTVELPQGKGKWWPVIFVPGILITACIGTSTAFIILKIYRRRGPANSTRENTGIESPQPELSPMNEGH